MNARGRDGGGYFFHRYFHTRLHTHSHSDRRFLTHPAWDQKHWPSCCLLVTSFIISHFSISELQIAPARADFLSRTCGGAVGGHLNVARQKWRSFPVLMTFSRSFQGHSLSGWGWSQKSCHILVRRWHCGASFQTRARPSSLRSEINFPASLQNQQ